MTKSHKVLPETGAPVKTVEDFLPFVAAIARRMTASMPHNIDVNDLIQEGVIGLMDAFGRFDESRGIKFETFAERRVRGAIIDALRKDAWPRGVRKQRRLIDAAREVLREELGGEPSNADLAGRLELDETQLERTLLRIQTIEATSPLTVAENLDSETLPVSMRPQESVAPDQELLRKEEANDLKAAIANLPEREQQILQLYYFDEAPMRLIGHIIGVNESRVSQLHDRAIRRLQKIYGHSVSTSPSALIRGRLRQDLQKLKHLLGQIEASDRQVFLAYHGLGAIDISEFGLGSRQIQGIVERVWGRLEQLELKPDRRKNVNHTQG